MLPPSALPSALVQAFSTLSRRGGDRTILHPVLLRLTGAGTSVADLRDLRPTTLDELPDGFLRLLGKHAFPHPADHPPVVALPDGCTASTVNRFLRELSGTECVSAPHVDAQRTLVDLPTDTALRLFETTDPLPYLRNPSGIPVLFRLTERAPSCVPLAREDTDVAPTRLMTVAALRDALCSDDCRLELPPAKAFGDLSRRLADLFASWFGRSGVDDHRKEGAHPRIQPNAEEQLTIGRALRMVPRELLPAPGSIAIEDLLLRMLPFRLAPPPYLKQGLDEQDLLRIAHLLDDQWHIASPPRGAFRPIRPPRDLVTLAKLQRWAWPDDFYTQAKCIDEACKARHAAATGLRKAWEGGQGFGEAMLNFAEWQVRLPEGDVLRRMGLLQMEALTARPRSRRVTFADPLSQADDPS
ncbi:hypothetical protein [Roseateles noduli]|jgi:hypothetical protein|uniref:hypothetical protein n=1 Tax=Roseateles noduli TaxID=2052484 RepID=UPI003D659CF3